MGRQSGLHTTSEELRQCCIIVINSTTKMSTEGSNPGRSTAPPGRSAALPLRRLEHQQELCGGEDVMHHIHHIHDGMMPAVCAAIHAGGTQYTLHHC